MLKVSWVVREFYICFKISRENLSGKNLMGMAVFLINRCICKTKKKRDTKNHFTDIYQQNQHQGEDMDT